MGEKFCDYKPIFLWNSSTEIMPNKNMVFQASAVPCNSQILAAILLCDFVCHGVRYLKILNLFYFHNDSSSLGNGGNVPSAYKRKDRINRTPSRQKNNALQGKILRGHRVS